MAMEEERRRERPHIEVHGDYYDIHDNTIYGGTQIIGDRKNKKEDEDEQLDFSPESVKHAIELLMAGNSKKNKRWWFVPYRVMKDAKKTHDLSGFSVYINKLFNDKLPIPIDIHDLSKEVEVLCFAKPVAEWTPSNAPVGGATYEIYVELIKTFKGFLQKN